MLAYVEHFSVAVSAISGALAGRGRKVDLFGVLVLSVVTAVGGGTVRDLCLGARPVFWIEESSIVLTAILAGLVTFWVGSRRDLPRRILELADAFGLALFASIGTGKALAHGVAPLPAIALGVATGVAGGVIRDVLVNELPMVFRKEVKLYATAAIVGCAVIVIFHHAFPNVKSEWAVGIGALITLALRLAAIRWSLMLPEFEDRRDQPKS